MPQSTLTNKNGRELNKILNVPSLAENDIFRGVHGRNICHVHHLVVSKLKTFAEEKPRPRRRIIVKPHIKPAIYFSYNKKAGRTGRGTL